MNAFLSVKKYWMVIVLRCDDEGDVDIYTQHSAYFRQAADPAKVITVNYCY